MKILLTNDDGIEASGLRAAAQALRQVGEVFVVAPDREQSGVGASLTLHSAVRVNETSLDLNSSGEGSATQAVTAFAVEGTPGDSCILALESVVGPVDLVVSGINAGSNLGWDVLVSGTVGAAIQGYVRGYPTIAISVGAVLNPQFETASQVLKLMAERLRDNALASSPFLNINVPSLRAERIVGIKVTRPGNRSYGESVRPEGLGEDKRYRISRNRPITTVPTEGTDIWALKNNYISISPMQMSLGSPEQMPEVESLLAGLAGQLLPPRGELLT